MYWTERYAGLGKLVRYADDFVCAFEKEVDANRFNEVLGLETESKKLSKADHCSG